MRPWYSAFDLHDRLRRLSPDDQAFARLAWSWVKRHALLIPALLLIAGLLGPKALTVVVVNLVFLLAATAWRAPRKARAMRDRHAQRLTTLHVPVLLGFGVFICGAVALFALVMGPLTTPAPLMAALFINNQGLEHAAAALLYYLGKEPPRKRRALRESLPTIALPARHPQFQPMQP
ncbi:hypothetical protein [Deinococcus navajonensis]|uniref:Transmembrane protein n=1 Tax=Deinococcus navajonensis TaxID=309884 RepID=A0ABV8XHG1_9DEIO